MTQELAANSDAMAYATCNVTHLTPGGTYHAETYGLTSSPDLSQECRHANTCSDAFASSLIPRTSGYSNCTFSASEIKCPHPLNSTLNITACQNITNLFNKTDVRCEYRRNDTRLVEGVTYLSNATVSLLKELNKFDEIVQEGERTEGLYSVSEEEEPFRGNFSGHWMLRESYTRPLGQFKLNLTEVKDSLAAMNKSSSAPYNLTFYCFAAMFN